MDPVELVESAETRLGVEGNAGLARALRQRLHYEADAQKIGRWRKRENKPDFDATIALLQAAELLSESPAHRRPSPADAQTSDLLEELEAEVAQVFRRLRQRLGNPGRRGSLG